MGTDIHLEVEVKRNDHWERVPHLPAPCWSCSEYNRETGEWENAKGFVYPWVDEAEALVLEEQGFNRLRARNDRVQMSKKEPCRRCQGTKLVYPQIYDDRNYDVFAVLADVRNGIGFAGIDTGDALVPIDEPRGLPDDLSQEVQERLRQIEDDVYEELERTKEGYWDLGDHSFSWVTLREVLEYDWSRTTKKRGWVDPWNFELFRRNGRPYEWAGGISGPSIQHISANEMAHRIDSGEIVFGGEDSDWLEPDDFRGRPYTTSLQRAMGPWSLPEGSVGASIRDEGERYFCLVEWEQPYLQTLGAFRNKMVELSEQLSGIDPDNIRLVFGFDS